MASSACAAPVTLLQGLTQQLSLRRQGGNRPLPQLKGVKRSSSSSGFQTPVLASLECCTDHIEASSDSVVARRQILLGASALAVAGAAGLRVDAARADGEEEPPFFIFYGQAASASSYGGYGGTEREAGARYTYEVPREWKGRVIGKVEKGTNGTDSEFYNPKRKEEKEYLLFLSGVRKLGELENVLNDISLSDIRLQDILSSADNVTKASEEKNGQLYYYYEVSTPSNHGLITVTAAGGRLYAHFVLAPNKDWARDEAVLRQISKSFATTPLAASGLLG